MRSGNKEAPDRPRDRDGEGWMPGPSRNQRECYMSRAECKMYAGAPCSGSAIKSRPACAQAGPIAGLVEASLCTAPTQGRAWSAARSPAVGLTTSSTVQPDSHGASSLAGTAGSLPQSWESGAGWTGAAARQTQIPDAISSHAISTAVTDLVRTESSLGQFPRLSSLAEGSEDGTDCSPSFLRFGMSAGNGGHAVRFLGGITPAKSRWRTATRGSPTRNGRARRQSYLGESQWCVTKSKVARMIVIQ